MAKNMYSSEVKWAVVKDKLSGKLTTREIMEKYNIKNKSQVTTWMRWYRNNEVYRFDQPIGKQYTFGHGPVFTSKDEKRDQKISSLKMQNEILKKSKVKTWIRWYRNNEVYRFDQPIGKQYTFGQGTVFTSKDEKRDKQISSLKMENEILKKYMEIKKELKKK